MSAPDFSNFLASLGADGLMGPPPIPSVPIPGVTGPPPLPSVGVQVPMPLPAAPTPAPVQPMPVPQLTPQHGFDLQAAIGPLAAIALAISGHPYAATGAAQGSLLAAESRRRDEEKQQQLQLAAQKAQLEQAQFLYNEEQKRQAGIQSLIANAQTQLKGVTKKSDYDNIVNGLESFGAQAYGLRPNAIRTAVPYRAPDFGTRVTDAFGAWMKANPQALDDGNFSGKIMVDALGDGHPIPIDLADAAKMSGLIAIDPTSGKPVYTAKRKDETPKFDPNIFAAVKSEWMADHNGQTPDQKALGVITEKAIQRTAQAAKVVDPVAEQLKSLNVLLANQRLQQGGGGGEDTDTLAQMLVDGRATPGTLSKRATTYNATLARANKLSLDQTGKPINLNKLNLDFDAAKRFVGSMNSNQMVRFQGLAGSVVNTIDEVKRLGDELKQGSIQKWNAAKRSTIQQVYGNTPQSELAAQYMAAVNTLKEEFAGLVQGGYAPTDDAFKLANQQVNADFGVKDLNASLSEVQRLINYRISAFNDMAPRTIGGAEPTVGDVPTVAKPASGGPQEGQIVTYQGKRVRIDKINPDGTFAYTVVR